MNDVFIGPYIALMASSKVIIDPSKFLEKKKLDGHANIALTTSSYLAQHVKVKPFFLLLAIDIN